MPKEPGAKSSREKSLRRKRVFSDGARRRGRAARVCEGADQAGVLGGGGDVAAGGGGGSGGKIRGWCPRVPALACAATPRVPQALATPPASLQSRIPVTPPARAPAPAATAGAAARILVPAVEAVHRGFQMADRCSPCA